MTLYYLGNARSQEQYDEMVRLEAAGECLFCPERLYPPVTDRVLLRNAEWAVVRNDFPYPGTSHHYMLIPRLHVERLNDLSVEAFAALHEILREFVEDLGLEYYGLGSRNGDPAHTGGTIRHLHLHLIVGDSQNEGEPVRLVLSSRPSPDPSPFA